MRSRLIGLAVLAAVLAGCGRHVSSGSVTLTVTRDFGAQQVREMSEHTPAAKKTVRELLEHAFGLSGTLYVNGSAASAATLVHGGDRIWLDMHKPAAARPGAVVGSFPEPFVHGIAGKRYPTTLACAADAGAACARVAEALSAIGVPTATQQLGTGSGQDTLGVVVGTWSELRGELLATLIEHGPGASGVYARFTAGGAALQLLDRAGRVVRTLRSGAGLVAATRQGSSAPTWVVTGTDLAGVGAAADALTAARLHDRFALAVAGGRDLAIPQSS